MADLFDVGKLQLNMVQNSNEGKNCNPSAENLSPKSVDLTKPPVHLSKVSSVDIENFTINVCKKYKISICKPLMPLKLALFIYYGAGSFIPSFITIIYKQRGISLSELSTMTIIAPVFQFMGTALSGIIADKLGRAKPVFFVNLFITLCVLVAIVVLPKINYPSNEIQHVNLTCHQQYGTAVTAQTVCGTIDKGIEVQNCLSYCVDELSDKCSAEHIDCQNLEPFKELNISLILHVNDTFLQTTNDSCQYNVVSITDGNSSFSWCTTRQNMYCKISCVVHSGIITQDVGGKISMILIAYVILFVLFQTTYSNCYRCLDVTVMFLVKEHDSSFGHERFFGMCGNVLISPIAGYIADATTLPGGERNYTAGIYLCIAMNICLLPILYQLPVRVKPPGEKMWRKALNMIKNPDALAFFLIVLVLGTAWNFGKYFLFWYLEEMNAKSVLIGLITSVSALYALPFLLTSHWWVKIIGATRMFILALLAYTVQSTGYSFLQNPWFSLVLEAAGIISYYLLWVAVMEYSHDVAPEGLTATVIAVSGAIHFSVGKVSAGLMGKFIMNHFGGRAAFRFSAIMTLIAAFLYALYLCIRNKRIRAKHQLNSTAETNEESEIKGTYTVKIKDEK